MKSVLLLAAVYSLIIHQWHKEKGTALAKITAEQRWIADKRNVEKKDPLKYTTSAQFLSIYTWLKDR